MTNHGRGSLPGAKTTQLFKMAKYSLELAEKMYGMAQEEGRGLASGNGSLGAVPPVPIPVQPHVDMEPNHQRCSYMLANL